ncbi:MAG: DUF4197 domain-containing protein [Micavibrio aeruginosavorus]|uniref:DUF4197 domain-containing protein n=1 Tax=Micavibrio aeruginosavorus TaxID=349221 RepID=A0A2W5N6V1_9BACT|nr:MAG: DUF4197 domain-containing protein [Micavibrio aeruginosavorus]
MKNQEPNMTKFLVLFLSVFLIGIPANAQTDWLGMVRSVLGSQTASKTTTTTGTGLSQDKIAAGLKEALNVGTKTVVAQLGKTGGFNLDPKIHIPLPPTLDKADKALKLVGMGSLTEDLESRMNRAAEIATPKAQTLFIDAIKKMTVEDARSILSSKQDAATQYLRKSMGTQLAAEMKPIVSDSLAQAGAVKAFDTVSGQYAKMPMVSGLKNNMNDYVTNKAMDGIFYYVAKEEASIRQNPAKRTTDLLKTVFGTK